MASGCVTFGFYSITFILLTPNGQRLGDVVAGTTLIKLTSVGALISQKIIRDLEQSDYQAQFPQVVRLSDKDISLIKEALQVNIQLGITRPMEVISEKIRIMFDIHSDMATLTFLNTVLKDYHHLTSAA